MPTEDVFCLRFLILLPPTLIAPFSLVAEITWAHDTAYLKITLSKLLCNKLEPHDFCSGKKKQTCNRSALERKERYPPFFPFLSLKLVDIMMQFYIEKARVQDKRNLVWNHKAIISAQLICTKNSVSGRNLILLWAIFIIFIFVATAGIWIIIPILQFRFEQNENVRATAKNNFIFIYWAFICLFCFSLCFTKVLAEVSISKDSRLLLYCSLHRRALVLISEGVKFTS